MTTTRHVTIIIIGRNPAETGTCLSWNNAPFEHFGSRKLCSVQGWWKGLVGVVLTSLLNELCHPAMLRTFTEPNHSDPLLTCC